MTSPASPPHSASRPVLVAVTATVRLVDGVDRVRLNAAYIRALEDAGLVPLVVPPLSDTDAALGILDVVSGLVLSGGEDLDPALYGDTPHPALGPVNCPRDFTELALLAGARERGLPTLAICRGIQVVNVGLGGTLVQDLPSQRADVAAHDVDDARAERVHGVTVDPSSRLARIIRMVDGWGAVAPGRADDNRRTVGPPPLRGLRRRVSRRRQLSIHFPSIRTWRISFSGEWWLGKSSASLMLFRA
jgi:hypothetical protein